MPRTTRIERPPRPEPVPLRRKVIAWTFVALMVFSVLSGIALIFAR